MGNKKHPFHRIITKTASAGTNLLEDDRVRSGRLYCFQRIAVENETTAYTRLRLEIRSASPDFLFSEQSAPQAGKLYWDDVPVYVTEELRLVAELTGCTLNDVLKMYLIGWWVISEGGE